MSTVIEQNIDITPAVSILKKHPNLMAAYIHGSACTINFRKDSDVDIALLLKPGCKISGMAQLRLAGELSAAIGREVHIGVLVTSSLIYAKEVLEKGKLLFVKNKLLVDMMVATLLSMYLQHKSNLKEILNAYSIR